MGRHTNGRRRAAAALLLCALTVSSGSSLSEQLRAEADGFAFVSVSAGDRPEPLTGRGLDVVVAATDGSDTAAGGADDRAAKVARIDGARTLRDRATLSSTAFYEPAETPRDFSTGARKEQGQGAAARLWEQLRQSQHELAARSAALDRERAELRSFLSEQLVPMLNASIQQQAEVEQQAAALEALAEDLQREHAQQQLLLEQQQTVTLLRNDMFA